MRLLLCLSLIFAATIATAKDAPTYRWQRDIELPDIATTTLVAVPLDSHFFQFTREGRPDVRLSDEKGVAVGFVIRVASEMKARSIRSTWTAEQTAAKVDADVGLQVDLVLREKESSPNGIRIITPLRDFKHQVRVESSADGTTWVSAGPPTAIFDYSRYVDARNDLVPFAANSHRHFRVTVEDITAEQESQLLELNRRLSGGKETDRTESTTIARRPFRIDRIEFYRDDPAKSVVGEQRLTKYPADHFKAVENEGSATRDHEHQTIVRFDTQREPITEIKLVTQAENFSRTATVEAEMEDAHGQLAWRKLATGALTRFAVGKIHREELTLKIQEVGATRYRVTIENRDSPPLPITEVELSGPLYELTFLASPKQSLHLEYGSPNVSVGKFDIAALQAALAQPQPIATAVLQAPIENSNARVVESWKPWNDTRVLIGAILSLTLLLGWGLLRAGQRINLPPDK